jgi:prepilin-type N-terminal cleavage/methylation domain-containing protein
MPPLHRGQGFTLVEIALVLVIIGSLVSGVLMSHEFIQSARVRALIAQQSDIKAAYYAFFDRYKALPGDYAGAGANLNCGATVCLDGDGDSSIDPGPGSSGNGNHYGNNGGNNGNHYGNLDEGLLAWTHLSVAGLLSGHFTMASHALSTPDESNSPKNPYGAYLQILFDSTWGYSTNPVLRPNRNLIPVTLAAEIDRKVDDGRPGSGHFQFSTYAGVATAPDAGGTAPQSCTTQDDQTAAWNEGGGQTNCGAASLL